MLGHLGASGGMAAELVVEGCVGKGGYRVGGSKLYVDRSTHRGILPANTWCGGSRASKAQARRKQAREGTTAQAEALSRQVPWIPNLSTPARQSLQEHAQATAGAGKTRKLIILGPAPLPIVFVPFASPPLSEENGSLQAGCS